MRFLNFNKVLCLSPHPDDVEVGMYAEEKLVGLSTLFGEVAIGLSRVFASSIGSVKVFPAFDLHELFEVHLTEMSDAVENDSFEALSLVGTFSRYAVEFGNHVREIVVTVDWNEGKVQILQGQEPLRFA